MRCVGGLICALALSLVGCGETAPTAGCARPLGDYCAGSECPTYAEAAQAACDGYWEVGTCGDFLHVWHRWGYGDHFVKYFDASGTLVAVEVWADNNQYCGEASFWIFYGPVPECQREATLVDAQECYEANVYCEANCPLQDREECTQQYLTTGSCEPNGTGGRGGDAGHGGGGGVASGAGGSAGAGDVGAFEVQP